MSGYRIVTGRDGVQRLQRAAADAERRSAGTGAAPRERPGAGSPMLVARVTSGTEDGDGYYPAVITAYDPVTAGWVDSETAVRLMPANGGRFLDERRYPCRPSHDDGTAGGVYVGFEDCCDNANPCLAPATAYWFTLPPIDDGGYHSNVSGRTYLLRYGGSCQWSDNQETGAASNSWDAEITGNFSSSGSLLSFELSGSGTVRASYYCPSLGPNGGVFTKAVDNSASGTAWPDTITAYGGGGAPRPPVPTSATFTVAVPGQASVTLSYGGSEPHEGVWSASYAPLSGYAVLCLADGQAGQFNFLSSATAQHAGYSGAITAAGGTLTLVDSTGTCPWTGGAWPASLTVTGATAFTGTTTVADLVVTGAMTLGGVFTGTIDGGVW